ncbi:hypothetical protein SCHPADRAFT_911960, partial [Schizopora paradoxa]
MPPYQGSSNIFRVTADHKYHSVKAQFPLRVQAGIVLRDRSSVKIKEYPMRLSERRAQPTDVLLDHRLEDKLYITKVEEGRNGALD